MKKLTLLILMAGSVFLAGCASVPMTDVSQDSVAKTFQPEAGKAGIYLNRKGAFVGGAVLVQTVLDGRIVGSIAPNTFQLLSVAPGDHYLTTSGQFENAVQAKVNAEAGKNYFFDVSLGMGFAQAHVNLKQIGEEEGKKDVIASKRAEAVTY